MAVGSRFSRLVGLLLNETYDLDLGVLEAGCEFEDRQVSADMTVIDTEEGAAGGVKADLHRLCFITRDREVRSADRY
jgi:hypothetical protein